MTRKVMEKEWKIGEIRNINGEWFQCLDTPDCYKCDFQETEYCQNVHPCLKENDIRGSFGKTFRKLIKRGVPFINQMDGKVYQTYFAYGPINIRESFLGRCYKIDSNLISIEIKNEEDKQEIKGRNLGNCYDDYFEMFKKLPKLTDDFKVNNLYGQGPVLFCEGRAWVIEWNNCGNTVYRIFDYNVNELIQRAYEICMERNLIEDSEYGFCEICGHEAKLERTYFYYPVQCECCEILGEKQKRTHYEVVRHCEKCIPELPSEIHPSIKNMDGVVYRAALTGIMPVKIKGKAIVNGETIETDINGKKLK